MREGSPVTVVPESVVSIDADRNDVVGSVPVGELPGQIRVVDDGVFVTSVTDKTLTRIDARTGEVKTSGEHAAGAGLAAAGDQLWVASESRAEVTRVSPRSLAAIETIALDADPGGLVYALPALAFDSLWVSGAAPSAVTRWSLRTNRVVRRYELQPLELPVELASGEGLMWIALLQSNELLRIDVATGGARRVGVGRGPTNPVLAFGSLWVSSTGQGTLWRIDPVTESVERIIDVGEVAFGVAAGGGSIWVGDYCGGAVLRIDPATNRVVARIETGYHPRWLAFAGGRLWVGVSAVEMFDFGCVQANAP
jgi:streptogramin lyase